MKKFEFYLDRKITTWLREKHTIEAKSYKEAVNLMQESFKRNFCENTFYEQERVYDTDEYISVEDNKGQATAELYADTENGDELIIDNLI